MSLSGNSSLISVLLILSFSSNFLINSSSLFNDLKEPIVMGQDHSEEINLPKDFKLIASSKYEAEQIEGMIKWLRINMYPNTIKLLGVSMGYQFPPRFMIKMMHRDDTESKSREIFNKIKPAYLKSVNATYNGTQQSFHIHSRSHL